VQYAKSTMGDFVGVAPFTAFSAQDAKRDLLLFDRIMIPGLRFLARLDSSATSDLEWLRSQGLVGEAILSVNRETLECLRAIEQDLVGQANIFTRLVAHYLRYTSGIDAIPFESSIPLRSRRYFVRPRRNDFTVFASCVPLSFGPFVNLPEARLGIGSTELTETAALSTALRIVLHEFPRPDECVSWEQLLEFRNDPALRHDRLALRRWVATTATQTRSAVEIANELDFLQSEFAAHMRLHKIKVRRGVIETIVVGTASVLEDLAKFRWGKLAERLFTLRNQDIQLLEAEASAPGREIVYLIKARDKFGR
jgi:hypothetical protein